MRAAKNTNLIDKPEISVQTARFPVEGICGCGEDIRVVKETIKLEEHLDRQTLRTHLDVGDARYLHVVYCQVLALSVQYQRISNKSQVNVGAIVQSE